MDGDGSSSSGDNDVSSTAADEGPRADPELPQPNASQSQRAQAQMRLYSRNMLLHHRVQSDPNNNTEPDFDGDGGDADGGHGDEFGSFILGAVPASGVAIVSLPEATVEGRESGECAVCLEEYEAGDALRTMPCAHGFHERCIFGWLLVSRLCPLCRFALPAEEDTDADDER